jgi:hypothetical protein
MKAMAKSWNLIRLLKLIVGFMGLVQSYLHNDFALGLVAGLLILAALSNFGCCNSAGCTINYKGNKTKKKYESMDSEL